MTPATSVLTGIRVREQGGLVIVWTESERYKIETELTPDQARGLAKLLTAAAVRVEWGIK